MKIVKKHAVTLFHYMVQYIECGYYPIDDIHEESKMISHILGFGIHHGLPGVEDYKTCPGAKHLPRIRKVARISLTPACSCAILNMCEESLDRDIDDSPELISLRKYLIKEFPVESYPENCEGE